MNWRQLFDLKGVNLWLIGAGIGWNVFWTFGALVLAYISLRDLRVDQDAVQVGLMIGGFVGPLLSGWLLGRMAADERGPTYGIIGSLGSVFILLFILLPTGGVLGVMVALVAVAGGLCGGLLSQHQRPRGQGGVSN